MSEKSVDALYQLGDQLARDCVSHFRRGLEEVYGRVRVKRSVMLESLPDSLILP